MTVYRQAKIRPTLEIRARVLRAVRDFFWKEGYLEVETPVRIPAPAPEEHVDAPESGAWFLHTSPELCMKRLLAAGFEKIYQICPCFRSGERGRRHLPEMALLEWYTAHADYRDMMAQCERLIPYILKSLGRKRLQYRGGVIDLSLPWERLTLADAFERYGSLSLDRALESGRFDEILGLEIEPVLGKQRPVFLYDYPVSCGALARCKVQAPEIAERFELYICGLELCNAFSELCDPVEQQARFEKTLAQRAAAGKSCYPRPASFLTALKDMPPAAGNALGIDRLVMLVSNCVKIDDVVTFIPEEL
jgi:lysyl-tRNA synthetase class 2